MKKFIKRAWFVFVAPFFGFFIGLMSMLVIIVTALSGDLDDASLDLDSDIFP